MRIFLLGLTALAAAISGAAQKIHIGVFAGAAAYAGELNEKVFRPQTNHPVYGLSANYELSEILILRAGVNFGAVEGADRYSTDTFSLHRNLSFKSKISEISAIGEIYLMSLYDHPFAPYIFGGLAMYHFNPYAFDRNNEKVYLKPLSTEGEGIQGYNDKRPYSLTQMALPFGAGLKFAVNDNIRIGLEVGLRKLFTDYLDDVSTSYISQQDLLQAKGPKAVEMAYRGDEVDPNATYPAKGQQRGGSKINDYYYFGGLHLTYRLGGGSTGAGGALRGRKSKFGCPANVNTRYR